MSHSTSAEIPKDVVPSSTVLADTPPHGSSSPQSGEEHALSPTTSDDGFDYRFVPLDLFSDSVNADLTDGFLERFVPELAKTMESFNELRMHQDQIMLVAQGNLVSEDAEVTKEVSETLQQVPLYRDKLVSLVKQMNSINKRVAKLKHRAQKLKEHRVTADKQKRQSEEKRKEREKLLEAKPAHK